MIQKTVAVLGKYDPTNYSLHELEFARLIGAEIGRLGGIVASDTSSGFSSWAGLGAGEVGAVAVGFSPASNKYEHENHYRLSLENISSVVYTGFGYLGRDLLMIRSSDYILVFLGNEKIGHEGILAKELQKPLIVITFDKSEDEIRELLGSVYEYAELYSSQYDLVEKIRHMFGQ